MKKCKQQVLQIIINYDVISFSKKGKFLEDKIGIVIFVITNNAFLSYCKKRKFKEMPPTLMSLALT